MSPAQEKALRELASTLITDEERGFELGESTEAILAALERIRTLEAQLQRATENHMALVGDAYDRSRAATIEEAAKVADDGGDGWVDGVYEEAKKPEQIAIRIRALAGQPAPRVIQVLPVDPEADAQAAALMARQPKKTRRSLFTLEEVERAMAEASGIPPHSRWVERFRAALAEGK